MAQGTVKWFNQEKGYDFISPDEGGDNLFVHYSGIVGEGFRSLEEGERVSFEVTRGKKGMLKGLWPYCAGQAPKVADKRSRRREKSYGSQYTQ